MDDEPSIEAQLANIELQSQAFDAHRRRIGRTIDGALVLLTIFVALCLLFTVLL
jgi:hypothetical protein